MSAKLFDTSETFDFVIVGGGTAGCVLAARLSESGRYSVLLIEAGGAAKSFWIPIPAGFSKLLVDPRYNWRLASEPEENTNNRVISIPRGKGLGGSTLINGMIYVRGQPQDYDTWARMGCEGWGFSDVLPYFQRIEAYDGGTSDQRGKGGPMPVTQVKERPLIADAFIQAADEAGYARNDDYNGPRQEGFGYYQVNQRRGRRVTAADAYLTPAMKRPNLVVRTNAFVTEIQVDDGRATGVHYRANGAEKWVSARREVVVAAGAVHTPHLLELSGLGDPAVLSSAGISVKHALPGIGANYIDHFCTRMNWRVKKPVTLNESTRWPRLGLAVSRYFLTRTGILTLGTGLAHGFVRTREDLDGPDVQFFFIHASYANAAERTLDRLPGMTIGVTQLRPESRGTIHVCTPDPTCQPAIRPNLLETPTDRRCLIDGMRIARNVIEQPAMDEFRLAEMSPGSSCESDDDWLAFARANGQTIYHASGTCRMGTDPESVVGARLRVHGVRGLRIADASVMPTIVSGNTQAAVLMIAEKGVRYDS